MSKNKVSWLSYIQALKTQTFPSQLISQQGIDELSKINQSSNGVFSQGNPFIHLLDYTCGKNLFVSKLMETMLGYDTEYFIGGGMSLTLENYQAKHLQLFNEEIFQDRLDIIKKVPASEQPNYIFTYNFQFKNKKGEYLNLLQR